MSWSVPPLWTPAGVARLNRLRWLLWASVLLSLGASAAGPALPADGPAVPPNPLAQASLARLPARMVWAWERPEDLRGLPPDVGVAWLAASVDLTEAEARVRPRQQPMRVSPRTLLIPVLHVDADPRRHPALNTAQRDAIVNAALRLVTSRHTPAIQLDFEVRLSQRPFLTRVVNELRRRLPPQVALSMTALASWCAGDHWLAALPADEIVPMAFRMDVDDARLRAMLAQEGRFPRARCQQALGTATDEPLATPVVTPRRYFFSPRSWTPVQWNHLPSAVTAPLS
jgi:hypothetical protein